MAALAGGVAEIVFPRVCMACGARAGDGLLRHVCPTCTQRIEIVSDPCCSDCGHPFLHESLVGYCPHCAGWRAEYSAARVCTMAKSAARALIHELKYRRGRHVLDDMAVVMRSNPAVLDYVRGAVLVPVPLHATRLRERGYNQSRLLADLFAREAGGGTTVGELLVRVENTVSQTEFDRQARRQKLKNAFALRPGASITPDLPVILVDDVLTTGSTLSACAGVLRRAGVVSLRVVAFGHG